MEMNYVKSTIEELKSSSSSRVHETLIKIRSKIIANDSGIKLFRQSGGLEYLLPHLRKPNEKILDITLSILGNCCLEEESNIAVGKLYIFGPLVNIIKTVCRDSIVGRACRVIGNLAQKTSNAEGLHSHGAVTALVALIENRDKTTSNPTLTMAVRAIRQLWMVTDKRDEMLSLNAVRCIAILLTTECETAGIIKVTAALREADVLKKSQEELIIGILKCLGYFTTHSTAQCAEQIQGDGRGYQCLVALTQKFESLALKCLMNLCYLSTCRPLLGIAGFVECLVNILQNIPGHVCPNVGHEPYPSSSQPTYVPLLGSGLLHNGREFDLLYHADQIYVLMWPDGSAHALAQLSGESVNRSRLRHCGGLPLLVAAARTNPRAMHALLQYVFDDTSFQILVNEGLVNLLTDELTTYLKTMNFEHSNAETEHGEMMGNVNSVKEIKKEAKIEHEIQKSNEHITNNADGKCSLFTRRKGPMSCKNEDELKVVIERDNMIVGFIDAVDSDATDDSQSEDDAPPLRRKCLKRTRSKSPKSIKKKSQLIKMASKDWSAGVYWEPKSPEWPAIPQASGSNVSMSPDRGEPLGPMSPYSLYSDGYQSGFSPEYRTFSSNKRAKWDWSPESGISTGEASSMSSYWMESQWSPGSSGGPTSPFSVKEDSSDSEISGRYSPVCSDNDGETADLAGVSSTVAELNAAQVAHDLDELIMEDDESVEVGAPIEDSLNDIDKLTKSSRIHIACVLVLLFRVSHGACNSFGALREEPVPNQTMELLTGRDCLNALLDYVERCKRPLGRAAQILAKVLSNALCLMSILKHRLALRLHNMSVSSKHPSAKCQQCKQLLRLSSKLLSQLTILAESSYGIGEISYQLLKGESSVKQTLSLTLPYIVRTEKPLKKYFIDCGALNLLFDAIANSKEDIQDCVTALAKLANNVHIKDPKTLENRFKIKICFDYSTILDIMALEEIVTFKLDDLSTVQASRIFLCQNSDVFSAMLMGCFKESVETCVRLKNVTKPALEYLFYLLYWGYNNAKHDETYFPMCDDLQTNLEVLLLADRFLFEKLKGSLSSAILQFQLTPATADKIYVWSLSEGMGFLCVESVAYLLTGKMRESDRTKSFKTILSLEFKDQWLEDIKSMILRQLVK